jgi:hypothetical protein
MAWYVPFTLQLYIVPLASLAQNYTSDETEELGPRSAQKLQIRDQQLQANVAQPGKMWSIPR